MTDCFTDEEKAARWCEGVWEALLVVLNWSVMDGERAAGFEGMFRQTTT